MLSVGLKYLQFFIQSILFLVVLGKTEEVPERCLGFWAGVSLYIHHAHGDSSSNQDKVGGALEKHRIDSF